MKKTERDNAYSQRLDESTKMLLEAIKRLERVSRSTAPKAQPNLAVVGKVPA